MRISDWSSDVCSSDLAKHRIMWETVWESRMGNLTVAAVKNAKPGRHSDGAGLILFVTSKKGKSRGLRAQVAGKRRDIGLDSFPADPPFDKPAPQLRQKPPRLDRKSAGCGKREPALVDIGGRRQSK